ncbi:YLP motif-containing protein 1-like [Ylistrum balloti]|uniref:YLP motif-containing protein 1-like n=1 Tax=Ylistrum balloti TaxID=509963 RepID=UPI0029058784|nr:YLP motif-containing protein 1-like [Ylistrum balloti]
MEESYRQNMFKSFKKTIDDGFFAFIILDAVNDRCKQFEEFWSYAKSKGFQVYIADIQGDVATCAKRNTHKRSIKELEKIKRKWEETPRHYLRLDIRSLLQEVSITDVEMEDEVHETGEKRKSSVGEEEDEAVDNRFGGAYKKSRWELDTSEEHLDKLDGLRHGKRKRSPDPTSMEDFLQLADDIMSRPSVPGKKRVQWADIEERKNQSRRREIGFVVGQTQQDWERITDHSFADRQLNQTKYF